MKTQPPVRILLIEDDLADVVLVREALRDAVPHNFELHSVTRLADGLKRLKEEAFDVVLLDLTLPDSYGIETFDELQTTADLPVVVLSGNANDELAFEALRHGAQDYLVKGTVSGELLVRMLRYAITRYRMTSELQQSEQRLRLLSEQLPAVLWTTDLELHFTSLRGRGLASMHLSQDEVVGRLVSDYFGASPTSVPLAMHHRALAGESTSENLNWGGHWYHAHVEPLRDARGEIIGTVGVALDFTDEYRLRRDVEAAHRIQQHLLPARSPRLRGFDIAGACFPATQCSGDFFDYIPLQGGRLAVVLADVSGHGFGPAIMAATIRSYLRTAAVLGNQVHEMLALGNRLILSDGDGNPFASAFSVCLDPRGRTIQFASAGHPAYLCRRDGRNEVLESPCVPIGIQNDEVFPLSRPIRMRRNDILMIASDGVFEARTQERDFFGVEKALDLVHRNRDHRASELVKLIHTAACNFAGTRQLDDDLTVVIIKAVSSREHAPGATDTVQWE